MQTLYEHLTITNLQKKEKKFPCICLLRNYIINPENFSLIIEKLKVVNYSHFLKVKSQISVFH